jgi:hypothetical protein
VLKIQRTGPSTTVLHWRGYTILFSYDTPVACYEPGLGYSVTEQKFSRTTTKHINQWTAGSLRPPRKCAQEYFDSILEEGA